ncbi:MAG: hypothetical protein EAZ92_00630 [Candidatus Kapaibacterium sp.]|nr:MAG: hypothetical protein EAZ92_00630 [Candidatus Kapabacteria bacterium]
MIDFLLDLFLDLKTENGDFATGESTLQNQSLLFQTQKGEWKQHPTTGIGADDFVDDDDLVGFENEIRRQCVADGMEVETLEVFEDGSVNLKANYGQG